MEVLGKVIHCNCGLPRLEAQDLVGPKIKWNRFKDPRCAVVFGDANAT